MKTEFTQESTTWSITRAIFNEKVSGKIFTKNELELLLQYETPLSWGDTTFWSYKNLLTRAGFLKTIEPGVYRKLKKIPDSLSWHKAKKLADHNKVEPTMPYKLMDTVYY